MAVSQSLVGKPYRYPDSYVVGREKIREYAKAVKSEDPSCFDEKAAAELGYPDLTASLTFTSVFGYLAISAFFEHFGVSVTDSQIVQVDQRIEFYKPVLAGDRIYCDIVIESIRTAHGTDIIMTKQVVTNEAGDTVQKTYTTLAGRAGDGEEGFNDGVA